MSFFFSSRRRHTISLRDWSSDVCSSDLLCGPTVYKTPHIRPDHVPDVRRLVDRRPAQVHPDLARPHGLEQEIGRASRRARVLTGVGAIWLLFHLQLLNSLYCTKP